MAKNWTIAEAVKVFEACKDNEAIVDIGRRFPSLANLLSRVVVGDKDAAIKLLSSMPEFLTAGKVDKVLKNGAVESDADADAEGAEEDDAEDEGKDDSGEVEYEKMSAKALFELCNKRGLKLESTKKAAMIAALKKDDGAEDDAEEDVEEKKSAGKYDKMSAVELFKECKKRGIKTETRLDSSVYVELLEKDDAAKAKKAKAKAEEEDEDWDENEEDKKPAKADKKSKKEENDDDEDWDI